MLMVLYLNPEHIKILWNNQLIHLGIINIIYIIPNSQDISSFCKIIDLIRLEKQYWFTQLILLLYLDTVNILFWFFFLFIWASHYMLKLHILQEMETTGYKLTSWNAAEIIWKVIFFNSDYYNNTKTFEALYLKWFK